MIGSIRITHLREAVSMGYLIWKLIHVLGVVLFVGNITTGILWKVQADRTRNAALIAHVCANLTRSDRFFTMPGVLLIVIAGVVAAITGHLPILGTGWIFWSIVLLTISGLAFMLRVAPLQRRMHALSTAGAQDGQLDWPAYEAATQSWNVWGMVALIAPLVAVALMVLKPALPGL
jgi:uncharacterized membrane protein